MSAGYVPEQFTCAARRDEGAFAEVPEAVLNTRKWPRCAIGNQVSKATKDLHYPVFHPPNISRAKVLAAMAGGGLFTRYTIHAKAEGKTFVVTGIDEPKRLPTLVASEEKNLAFDSPIVTAAIKTVIDRLDVEMESSRRPASFPIFSSSRFHPLRPQPGNRLRGARSAAARLSPTCSKSRTWIRSATACCSSGS